MSNDKNNDIQTRWVTPINRIGQFTLIMAAALSFLPFLYLVVRFGAMPPMAAIGVAIINVVSAFGAAYVVEPVSYFPALGTAGSYMGILAGSIGQMRVPAALVAKSVAGVENDTQEAELVAICGIAGSIFLNCIVTTLTAIAGSFIISVLPEFVLNALSAYILPAIFSAVLAMFTTKGKLQITLPMLAVALGINYLVKIGVVAGVAAKFVMLMCVILGVIIARIEYKKGWAR